MKKPLDPRKVELEPFFQLCWLGAFTVAYALLSMLWDGGTLQGRPPYWAAVLWLSRFLTQAVALALAWGALRVARERGETKLGLATAAFFAMHWWGALFFLRMRAQDSGDLQSWMVWGASVWSTWVAYRFFWAHCRTLGSRDSGTRSSGLPGILFLCLPALTLHFVDFIRRSLLEGRPFSASMVVGLMFLERWLTGVMLLWAIAKMGLVSAREQGRERPVLPRAIRSSLVLLLLSGPVLLVQQDLGLLVPTPWAPLTMMLMLAPLLVASLGAGLLAHRLSASVGAAGPAPARFSTDLRTWARNALQKKPPNPHMVELGPFYQLCWLGLLFVLLNLLFVLWMISVGLLVALWGPGPSYGHPAAIALTGGLLVLFLMAWRFIHERQKGGQQARAARGSTSVRPRLQSRFDALRDKLREFSGDASARLVLTPETAVVLSTVRSKHEPLVEVTAGFWSTYASTPHLMDAAVAHEAGHIAARDVERFLRMLSLMRTLVWFFLPVAAVLAGSATTSFELIKLLGVGLALALAWSALLVAREVQADVFAVKVLGDRRPLESLLERQRSLRAAQSGGRALSQRLRTWLLQPNLRWRATLPALRGHLGGRVEAKLGLATAAFIGISYYGTEFVTLVLLENHALRSWTLRVMGVWIAWISYHFLWSRSRALGNEDPGARPTGLLSLLSFCLPGLAFLWVSGVFLKVTTGTPFVESTVTALHFVKDLLVRAVLLWATGKVALVSARERRRERPSLPRAVLSLLGIVLLVMGVLFAVSLVSGFMPSSWFQLDMALHPIAASVGLVTGLLAHRFSRRA
ncbi:hypothetical protein BO221_17805 [Archangium sp. Cb G35]|uniref:M48 family metalloprotease n=1 Tax=Archangium sp. Cb G35 TaxID=1920190 RepID=UPI0009367955|nr:M48 family metalloprotease [Archangium sp. Cb G35]OJT23822.1 hypothetical protein BO221_17805 [Archangium sp. Cb G35]